MSLPMLPRRWLRLSVQHNPLLAQQIDVSGEMPHTWQPEEHEAQKPECCGVGDGGHAFHLCVGVARGAYDECVRIELE